MFFACENLVSAPEVLPATSLTEYCYYSMFQRCYKLVSAPDMPATSVAPNCCHSMFASCTSLSHAPVLLSSTLATSCYASMFNGCTSLNYIKCLASEIGNNQCVDYWVSGVATSGTFVKASGAQWLTGGSGIPEGWTVEEL